MFSWRIYIMRKKKKQVFLPLFIQQTCMSICLCQALCEAPGWEQWPKEIKMRKNKGTGDGVHRNDEYTVDLSGAIGANSQ